MTIISYAQNYEDIMLWRALKDINKGFYIDIGAYSPTYHSVTKLFYDAGWRGINIEPNPIFIDKFNKEKNEDINLTVAVSDVVGEAEVYAQQADAKVEKLHNQLQSILVTRSGRLTAPLMKLRSLMESFKQP